AQEHGGQFPTGGATPEASFSLLYSECVGASLLLGKGYPEEPARKLLESGQPLTPETCGWHYVDGLRQQKDPRVNSRVAIVWDKFGSDHNSGLLPEGGHTVVFMDGSEKVIGGQDWGRFIADQEKAWDAIRKGEDPGEPWIPDRF
ncbi:MAG TPA: hypothetical protein VMF30_04985, partial [Pirellulales bacterium]|nr:hypothetical protein [Pirellulales bacterium]